MTDDGQSADPPPDRLSSCDVSDACDRLGVAAARTGSLRPLWPGCPAVSGRLTTIRLEPAAETPLPDILDLLPRAGGGLILLDLEGRLDLQCWGTVLATAAARFGVRGALVNGAARDVDGLQELGFPSFARGVHPAAVRGRLGVASVDEPVDLDGWVVRPGSFAIADASGAVFLPRDRADDVLALAAELHAHEREQLLAIAAGADPRTVLRSREQARQP